MPEELTSTAQQVEQVRQAVGDLLHPRYDTHYNILRWIQGANYNVAKATHMLRKHLKFRREMKLDTDNPLLQRCPIADEHAPLCVLGTTGPESDRLLVVDQAGKIDVGGVLKSVQPTDYIHQLYRNVESILKKLNEMEARLGKQCYAYYVFDLDGLSFDPTMVTTVTGPFRISWELMAMHYREWIDKFIVVNTPGFINILWTAISPFIPEDGRGKIVFPGKNFRQDFLELCEPSHLPEKYGGTRPNDSLKTPVPVPKEKFWAPKPGEPHVHHLHKVSIPASKTRELHYFAKAGQKLVMHTHNDSEISVGLYFGPKMDTPEDDLDSIVPLCSRAGLPAIDVCHFEPSEDGFFLLKLTNQASWLLPSSFRVLVLDDSGVEIPADAQREKWIKPGQPFKK